MNLDALHPGHQRDPESLRRLFVTMAIVSTVVILVLGGLGFYRVFSGFVIASANDDSVQLCQLLIDQQKPLLIQNIPGLGAQLAIDNDVISRLDRNMHEFLHPFDIIKIKIYDTNRRIIYSTETRLIGKTDRNNRRLANALAGNVDAKMVHKEKGSDLAGEQLLDVDVVETYVPVRDKGGKVLGSFEVYVNVTKYRNMIRTGVAVMTAIMVVVLAAVYGISYLIIRWGTVQLRQVQSKLEMLAITDALTGVANRGHVMARGEDEFSRAVRNRERDPRSPALGCIMLDIDHFKRVNDTRGHQTGDQVLREVAMRLRQSVRPYDIIGRYGGEEFVVLMPDTSFEQGLAVAERIRTAINGEPVCICADGIRISVSLGVSCYHENDRDLGDLLKRADEGLYKAKDGGRDRVEWICSPLVAEAGLS